MGDSEKKGESELWRVAPLVFTYLFQKLEIEEWTTGWDPKGQVFGDPVIRLPTKGGFALIRPHWLQDKLTGQFAVDAEGHRMIVFSSPVFEPATVQINKIDYTQIPIYRRGQVRQRLAFQEKTQTLKS